MINILIVDDQKSVRARLKHLVESAPDFKVVGTAKDGLGAIEQVKALRPDIVLLDMEMPKLDGLNATRIISQQYTHTKILVLSSHNSEEYVAKSIAAGATGYLLKGTPEEEIQQAIRFVYKGYTHFGAGLFEKMLPIVKESALVNSTVHSEETFTTFPTSVISDRQPREMIEINSDYTLVDSDYSLQRPTNSKWQVLAWLIVALSLTTGIYTLRQRLRRPLPTLSHLQQTATFADTKFTGKIQPGKTFKIAAIAPTVVKNIYVQVGEKVKAGQPLLAFHNLDAERTKKQALQEQQFALQQQQAVLQQQQIARGRILELEQKINNLKYNLAPLRARIAEANLRVSLAQSRAEKLPLRQRQDSIQRTKVIYERALARFKRWETLHKQGAISQEQLEQAQADLGVAKVDFTTAQAAAAAGTEIELSQTELSRLQKQLAIQEQEEQIRQLEKQKQTVQLEYQQATEKLKLLRQQTEQLSKHQLPEVSQIVTATKSGVVVKLPVTVGDQLFTGNPLVELAELEQMKVEVPVHARVINALRPNQRAVVTVGEGVAAQEFEGTIATINPLPAENLNYLVEVEFTNLNNSLLIRQSAKVQFYPQTIAGGN